MRLSDFLLSIYAAERVLAPESIRQLQISVRLFERQYPDTTLANIDHTTVNKWSVDNGRDWSPRTTNHHVGNILTLWEYASEIGLCETQPPRKRIRRPKSPRRIPDAWTLDQLAGMREACKQFTRYLPNGVVLGVLLDTTVLCGFYSALRPQDLMRLERNQLTPIGSSVAQSKRHMNQVICRTPQWVIDKIDRHYPATVARVWAWPYRREYFYTHWKAMLVSAGLPSTKRDGLQKLRRTAVSYGESVRLGYGAQLAGHVPGSPVTYANYADPRIVAPQTNLLPDLRDEELPRILPFRSS